MSNAYEQLFLDGHTIHWVCDKSHKFGEGQIRTPNHCPQCGSPLVDSVIETKTKTQVWKETTSKVKLSADEEKFLAKMR